MSQPYKTLEITCPVCNVVKSITVPEAVFGQKKFGTIKIQVPPGAVCAEHQFLVFVDTKGIIRGYEKIDIHMAATVESKDKNRLTLQSFIQFFGLYGLFSMIHSKIFKYPAYILGDKDSASKSDVINLIGNNLLPERYRGSTKLVFLVNIDLSKFKIKDKKDALIMDDSTNILQTPWEEKLKFEEEIIKKGLEIIDEDEQLIILQQEIAKFIREAEHVVSILEDLKEIYEDDLVDRLSRELMISKINHYRLALIREFIKRRFDPKLAQRIKNKVEEFLGLL